MEGSHPASFSIGRKEKTPFSGRISGVGGGRTWVKILEILLWERQGVVALQMVSASSEARKGDQ